MKFIDPILALAFLFSGVGFYLGGWQGWAMGLLVAILTVLTIIPRR